jgi:hypothetical protein
MLAAGCAHVPSAARPTDSAADPAQALTYSLRVVAPEAGAALEVCAHLDDRLGPLPDPLLLDLPDAWAGRPGLGADIHSLAARADDVPTDPHRRGARVSVDHRGATDVELCYRVSPAHRLATEASRFRAVSAARRFFAPGHAILAQPVGVDPRMLTRVALVHRDATAPTSTLRSTVEPTAGPCRRPALGAAAWFAGAWTVVERGDERAMVRVAIDPGLPLDAEHLADRVAAVALSQAPLLGPTLARRTVAVVLARDDDPTALTGNGRHGGFVLELGHDAPIDEPALIELIAHENLHRLIGHALRFAPNEEIATLWFREGLTDYLAIRLAVDRGLLPEHRLFRRIAAALTHYRSNPAAATPLGDVDAESFWRSRDLRRLPYDQGTLIALLIDLDLRARGLSLEGWVAELRDDPSARLLPLTNAALRDALARYSGTSWSDFFASWVEGGGALPVFEALRGAGLDVVERLQPAPFFGFRVGLTADGVFFVEDVVDGSPAAAAGLRAGAALAAEPVVPSEPGAGAARLVVRDTGGSLRTVVIEPARGQRRAFVLEAHDDDAERFRVAFGLAATGP